MKYWWNSDIYYFKINIYLYQLYYNHETFSFSHTYNKTILVFANIINILHSYILHNYIFAFEWKIHFIFYILYYSYYIHRFRYIHEIFNYFKLFQSWQLLNQRKKNKYSSMQKINSLQDRITLESLKKHALRGNISFNFSLLSLFFF